MDALCLLCSSLLCSSFPFPFSFIHSSLWAHEKEYNDETNSNCKVDQLCNGQMVRETMMAVMYEKCLYVCTVMYSKQARTEAQTRTEQINFVSCPLFKVINIFIPRPDP